MANHTGDQIVTRTRRFRFEIRTFRVTDPTINANYGCYYARTPTEALGPLARTMGFKNYRDYAATAANHNGVRTLEAVEVKVSA